MLENDGLGFVFFPSKSCSVNTCVVKIYQCFSNVRAGQVSQTDISYPPAPPPNQLSYVRNIA